MVTECPKWSQRVKNYPKMFNMVLNGFEWSSMVPNGPKWSLKMDHKFNRMVFITRFNLVLVWSKLVQILTKMSCKLFRHNQVSWSSFYLRSKHFILRGSKTNFLDRAHFFPLFFLLFFGLRTFFWVLYIFWGISLMSKWPLCILYLHIALPLLQNILDIFVPGFSVWCVWPHQRWHHDHGIQYTKVAKKYMIVNFKNLVFKHRLISVWAV